MVTRNVEGGFEGRFVCFTDRPQDLDGVETAPLPADLPGWWSKLALFREGLFPKGDRVIFFDLDTVITGPIDALAKYDSHFAILKDFFRPFGMQSAVMAWEAGEQTYLWESYERAGCPTDDPKGDQYWIEINACRGHVRYLQTIFPKMFVSYKQTRGIPVDASVVVFHGKPRPHEVTEGWVPKVWKINGLSHSELKAVCNTAHDEVMDNVRFACARKLPWFLADREPHDRHVAIIGGGPSVRDKLREIKWRKSIGQDIWVLNNAHKALPYGLEIDAQVLLDARPENVSFLCKAKEYLIASQCHPNVFDAAGETTLWHVNSPGMADLLKDEPTRPAYLIGGGTTVGLNAIALAFARGYRFIHLYGFDSSYRDGEHHAYSQALNDSDPRVDVLFGEKGYVCAPWMVGQANEFMEVAPSYEADGCTITVHGEGLLPDIARDLSQYMTPAQIRADEILKRVPKGGIGVEVGVFAGDLSRALLMADPALKLIMVDSWEGDGAAYQGDSGDWHAELTQAAQDSFKGRALRRVEFAEGRIRIIQKRSIDALSDIANQSCDFVFIDADHSYEGCVADIEGWVRKVKPGGWLCGHDYQNPGFEGFGVTRAVNEFAYRNRVKLDLGENYCWFVQLPEKAQRAA